MKLEIKWINSANINLSRFYFILTIVYETNVCKFEHNEVQTVPEIDLPQSLGNKSILYLTTTIWPITAGIPEAEEKSVPHACELPYFLRRRQ